MKDLTLDFENKKITNTFLTGKDLIMQQVVLALQCWAGDWFLDGEFGVPYDLRLVNEPLLIADMQEIIMSVDGVLAVQDIDVNIRYGNYLRRNGKMFEITATVITIDNEQVSLNGLIPIVGK